MWTKRNHDRGQRFASIQNGMGNSAPASMNHIIGLYSACVPKVF